MPLVSLPAAPASARKQGVYAVSRNRQPRLVQHLVAIEIRHRNLGRRNQPVVGVFELAARRRLRIRIRAAKQILGKLGQLPRPEQAAAVHHERRQHFGVSVLLRVQVQHEPDQRPLQARPRAHVHRKPRPAQLGRAFQVQNPQRSRRSPNAASAQNRSCASRPTS